MGLAANKHIEEVLRLSQDLMSLSEEGEADSPDDGCRLLYGIVRDCAHKMRSSAERERDAHRRRGIWERSASPH